MRLLIFLLFLSLNSAAFGGFTYVSGRWSPDRFAPAFGVQEHYDKGLNSVNQEKWEEGLVHFMTIAYHFRESPFYADALFYTGVCYYFLGELDLSNDQFNRYLSQTGKLKNFEKAFEYKYQIAENFANGKKKHLFGVEKLPKWSPAKSDALKLYDEIIAALPGREIAAKALFSKAGYHRGRRQFKESVEALKTLQRFFPRHPLAAESFLVISEIYFEECQLEAQNPDLIALAQLNATRFGKSFPGDARKNTLESNILAMKEVYAQSLYETGRFYERKKKPEASAIYYQDTLNKYPETVAAKKSLERLASLKSKPKSFIASK